MPHLSQLLGAPGKHCHSLAGSCIAPISASIITQPPLHVLLCLTGLGAYSNSYDRILTLILLRLQRPYFQLRSHSEVLSFHEFGEKALYIPHRQHLSPEGILMTCTILGPRPPRQTPPHLPFSSGHIMGGDHVRRYSVNVYRTELNHFTGEGNGNALQYSCLENPMDRGAWWATVHAVKELDTTE